MKKKAKWAEKKPNTILNLIELIRCLSFFTKIKLNRTTFLAGYLSQKDYNVASLTHSKKKTTYKLLQLSDRWLLDWQILKEFEWNMSDKKTR